MKRTLMIALAVWPLYGFGPDGYDVGQAPTAYEESVVSVPYGMERLVSFSISYDPQKEDRVQEAAIVVYRTDAKDQPQSTIIYQRGNRSGRGLNNRLGEREVVGGQAGGKYIPEPLPIPVPRLS